MNRTIINNNLNIDGSNIIIIILLLIIFGLIIIYIILKYCCIITLICCYYGCEICSYCDKPKIKNFIIETLNIPFGTVISPTIINKINTIV